MQIVRSELSPITKQELHGRQPLDTIVPFDDDRDFLSWNLANEFFGET